LLSASDDGVVSSGESIGRAKPLQDVDLPKAKVSWWFEEICDRNVLGAASGQKQKEGRKRKAARLEERAGNNHESPRWPNLPM